MGIRHCVIRAGWLGGLALAIACVGLSASDSAAQTKDKKPPVFVVMNDGFSIFGYVKQEQHEIEVDPYQGVPVAIPKGFFLIDDGPRRIPFPSSYVGHIEHPKNNLAFEEEPITHVRQRPGLGDLRATVPSIMRVINTGAFDRDWERTMKFGGVDSKGKSDEWEITQHVGRLTPYSLRLDSTKYFNFSSAYLTREFSSDVIAGLLRTHPDFDEGPNVAPADRLKRRLAYAEFMVRAGFFDKAEDALARAVHDFPNDAKAINDKQKIVADVKARETADLIKRLAVVAGQHQSALRRINNFLMDYPDADEKTKTDLRGLKADYERTEKRIQEAAKHLKDLAAEVGGENQDILSEAAGQIRAELCFDNVARLETFLEQAHQYELNKKNNTKSDLGPVELLSLATSSWLLGNAAGETKPATAVRLWKARQLVLKYEKTDDLNERQKMAAGAAKEYKELAQIEEVSQVVSNLPPTEPGEITRKVQSVKAGKATNYELLLPPEYRHGRHYPVLIVLHQAGESPRNMLRRWENEAADNGYILAAPEWATEGLSYTYSEREQQTVLDTIRDLRRRYHVDSDRIFLFGLREGGEMALDVGLSHPDLFAGVSTMGAGPDKYSEVYWRNAQYLPFYVVNGERVGKVLDRTHAQFKLWFEKLYPVLWVQYKGRGAEWFEGEVPMIFEWMRVKRRAFPLTQLARVSDAGFGTEFTSQRPTDNSFYWLTTDDVDKMCWNGTGNNFRTNVGQAQLAATIYPHEDYTDIRVKVRGVNQVSVWLGRNLNGDSMIDFNKPVSFRIGDTVIVQNKKKVTPSLEVMLEDLYRRGDRQRVYIAKLDWVKPRR